MMINFLKSLATLMTTSALMLFLASCGGGGSGGAILPSVSGKVIDGYITGAKVCLDLNSNNMCDSNEPYDTTGPDGSYKIQYAGSVAGLQIIAQINNDATDSDLGKISIPFTLSAPVPTDPTQYSTTHVTPLTTLVAATIQQAGGQSAITPSQAQAQVIANLGLLGNPDLSADFKASNNTTLASIATFTAVSIAQASNNLSTVATAASLNPGQVVSAAVQQVQSLVLPAVLSNGQLNSAAATAVSNAISAKSTSALTASGGVVTSAINLTPLSAANIQSNSSGGTISGSLLDIVNGTKGDSNSNVVNLQAAFNNGILIVQKHNDPYINSSGQASCYNQSSGAHLINTVWNFGDSGIENCSNNLEAEFLYSSLTSSSANIDIELVLVQNSWYTALNENPSFAYDGKAWVPENGPGNQGNSNSSNLVPIFSNNCVTIPVNLSVSQQLCAVQVDVSNQKITDYISDICSNSSASSNCSTATFPQNSIGYVMNFSVQSSINDSDNYNGLFQINPSKLGPGYCTESFSNNSCSQPTDTIEKFIDYHQTNVQFMGNNCNTPFKIVNYDSTKKQGIIEFTTNSAGCSNSVTYDFSNAETQTFNVITKANIDIMIFPTPSAYKLNNPGSLSPYKIFGPACISNSTTECGIYGGDYMPTNFTITIPFNGDLNSSSQIVNPTLFDAVMTAGGLTKFPYFNASASGTPVNGANAPN